MILAITMHLWLYLISSLRMPLTFDVANYIGSQPSNGVLT